MQIIARYGFKGAELIRFSPEEGWNVFDNENTRFRQVQLQSGAFDLVLGQRNSPEPYMEHFEVMVSEDRYQRCLKRFTSENYTIQERTNRSFFTTPFGVRLELVAPHHGGYRTFNASDHHTLTVQHVRFAVQDPQQCSSFFSDALGTEILTQLHFEPATDSSKFRPVEIRLSSTTAGSQSVMTTLLPGISVQVDHAVVQTTLDTRLSESDKNPT
ncbi:hypothetical protein [Alicyclobacillus suci]|uniref:hypothetical protein n=1 Tax=Alicyclobacillus suci TaxID=2816080 RepID=UPI001A8E0D3A|nr:hypothetical protein [Alicyclobacillus suci]